MKTDISNQLFVKDAHRDKSFTCTVKCAFCNEEENCLLKLPFPLKDYIKFINKFVRKHNKKGCNKVPIPAPEWASKKVELAIANSTI